MLQLPRVGEGRIAHLQLARFKSIRRSLLEYSLWKVSMSSKDEVELLPYEDKHCEDFGRITTNWVSKLFVLEAHDLEQIAHPERIITDGGYIVIAKLNDRIVGTGALLYRSEGVYEVAKMGVDEDIRGYGIGGKIMTDLIQHARNHFHAKVLKIETSSKLDNAIHLYKKHGFVPDSINESVHGYARADVYLTYDLTATPTTTNGDIAAVV